MQIRNTLGIDPTVTIPGVSLSALDYGIISFETNGDTDINLLIEGGKPGDSFGGDGGIPDIQTEFYFQARYGEGSDRLSYVTQAVYDAARAAVEAGGGTKAQNGEGGGGGKRGNIGGAASFKKKKKQQSHTSHT